MTAARWITSPSGVRPARVRRSADEARRWWLEAIAAARCVAREGAAEQMAPAASAALVELRRCARLASGDLSFPVEGSSARLAADAFLSMARATGEALIPARREIYAVALAAIGEALEALLDEHARGAAAIWRKRFGDED